MEYFLVEKDRNIIWKYETKYISLVIMYLLSGLIAWDLLIGRSVTMGGCLVCDWLAGCKGWNPVCF